MRPPRVPMALVLAALGCTHRGALAPPRTPTSAEVHPSLSVSEDPALLVRAREAPVMPGCTAEENTNAIFLSAGVPATPSIARTADGRVLVAYVTDDNDDGRTEVRVVSLDDEGTAGTPVALPDAGQSPDAPVLVARGDGFMVAWRQGPVGHRRIAVRALDARGVPVAPVSLVNGVEGWLGAPALALSAGRSWLAVIRADAPPADPEAFEGTHAVVIAPDGTLRDTPAPAGGAYDGEAPELVPARDGVRAFATVARRGEVVNGERALVRLPDTHGAAPVLIARDLDHPAALPAPGGGTMLVWRARVARHDVAMRLMVLGADDTITAPPVTVGTWRGAFGMRAALVPLGALGDLGETVGVFTASTLSDDNDASVNVSLVTARGDYVGRAPVLASALTRSAGIVAVATGPGRALAVLDRSGGRVPALGLERVRCDAAAPIARLDVPPPTWVQDVADPDAPTVSLAHPGAAEMTCTPRGAGLFVTHASGTDDALGGTAAAAVVTLGGAVLLAVVKAPGADHGRLVMATVDGRGQRSPVRTVTEPVDGLLAAEAVHGGVLAVVTTVGGAPRTERVMLRGGTAAVSVVPGLGRATSAAVVPETGVAFVSAANETGDVSLYRMRERGEAVREARLRPGDEVRDAVRGENRTVVLLERADGFGEDVARMLARVEVLDIERHDYEAPGDPFAEPLGYPRSSAVWARGERGLAVLYAERTTVRLADVSAEYGGMDAHSVLGVYPGGGRVLSAGWTAGVRWAALATGVPDDGNTHAGAVTLAAVRTDGVLRGVTTALGDDASAVADGVALGVRAVDGGAPGAARVVLVYPRVTTSVQGIPAGLEWRWTRMDCAVPGGGR